MEFGASAQELGEGEFVHRLGKLLLRGGMLVLGEATSVLWAAMMSFRGGTSELGQATSEFAEGRSELRAGILLLWEAMMDPENTRQSSEEETSHRGTAEGVRSSNDASLPRAAVSSWLSSRHSPPGHGDAHCKLCAPITSLAIDASQDVKRRPGGRLLFIWHYQSGRHYCELAFPIDVSSIVGSPSTLRPPPVGHQRR